MGTMGPQDELDEKLREYCSLGDEDSVATVLRKGANVNSQNKMNGWTGLHWAAKRGHTKIVDLLVNHHAANVHLENLKQQTAQDLTNKSDIRDLLKSCETLFSSLSGEGTGEHQYITNHQTDTSSPTFLPYATSEGNYNHHKGGDYQRPKQQNNSNNDTFVLSADSPSNLAQQRQHQQGNQRQQQPTNQPSQNQDGDDTSARVGVATGQTSAVGTQLPAGFVPNYLRHPQFPYVGSEETEDDTPTRKPTNKANDTNNIVFDPGLASTMATLNNDQLNISNNSQRKLMLGNSKNTSRYNSDSNDLVIKVRQADAEETDFIEIDFPCGSQSSANHQLIIRNHQSSELTFKSLVATCCSELGVSVQRVQKVRKLPNTIVRNDRDVSRLQQFQELEIVVSKDN